MDQNTENVNAIFEEKCRALIGFGKETADALTAAEKSIANARHNHGYALHIICIW